MTLTGLSAPSFTALRKAHSLVMLVLSDQAEIALLNGRKATSAFRSLLGG
jgi:hypothetical protein